MHFVGQLWLPILLATVFSFIMSAVIWMLGPHHKKEWQGVGAAEDPLMDVLRKAGTGQGGYMFPFGDRSDKAMFEAAMKKWAEGPAGVLYVFPRGQMGMGKMLVQQFLFFLAINVMLAYVGHHASLDGQPYLRVFQVIGAVAFLTYSLGTAPESIWFGRPWKSFWLQAVDGLVYAFLSAGTFGWLWPR